jgi:hypothetical protein
MLIFHLAVRLELLNEILWVLLGFSAKEHYIKDQQIL